jgi:hypothetical protein
VPTAGATCIIFTAGASFLNGEVIGHGELTYAELLWLIENCIHFRPIGEQHILDGSRRPDQLPVEQPMEFRLAINLACAKALGLIISPTLLARADEVIEWNAGLFWSLPRRSLGRAWLARKNHDELSSTDSVGSIPGACTAFLGGLKELGFVEGQNIRIERRGAEGQYNRLPSLAAELIGSEVAVIVCFDAPAAFAAKAASTSIPIVFCYWRRSGQNGPHRQLQPARR